MERFDETAVTEAILAAPGWARVGITMPDPNMRERAATELARTILQGPPKDDANQLKLPID